MTFFRVIRLPCCIDPKVQCMCNAVWDGFQVYACFDTVVLTQMEVDFDTHLKSI